MLRKLFLTITLFTLCLNVYADDSSKQIGYPPQKIMGFLGLDTEASAPLIADGRATDLKNVKLSSTFNLRKREGYNYVNASLDDLSFDSPAVTGIFDASFSSGTNYAVVFVGDKIKYNNSGTWTTVSGQNPASAADISTGQNYQFQCVMALDTVVCTNDKDTIKEINSTPSYSDLDVSDLTNALTDAKTVVWFRNYLILGNTIEATVEKPTRFRWSDVGTTETWDDDNYIDIAELGGDEIIGFAELQGNLYVFLKNSIYRITLVGGDDIFTVNRVIDDIGAVARDTIRNVRLADGVLGIMFLSEKKKVYFFDGVRVFDIGKRIQESLDNLSESRLQYATAIWDDKNYYLSATDSGSSTNDIVYVYQTEIGEWTKYTDVNANCWGRVLSSSKVKTYFGDYSANVFWLDDPDVTNDVDGATGIVDSVETYNYSTRTGAQAIIDATMAVGTYTGAIMKITSGTAAGEEAVVLDHLPYDTGLVMAADFSTTPDSTSVYSIGAIDAEYKSKWYDMGDSARNKIFRVLYFWAAEASSNEVDINHAVDFGSSISSETIDLAPASSTLWDSAIWDLAIWGTTGDRFETIKLGGRGRYVQVQFENDDIDETFNIYGFHILADALDVR